MSGHSKWSTIKRKKAVIDAKRSKLWSKVIKEIQVAVRMSGDDVSGNPRLRLALDKARSANVPKDSIQRAIDKGSGAGGGEDFEEVVYEGYATGGVAVMVECLTDNRNRTAAEIRYVFQKHHGNLGSSGSVAWMFRQRGLIVIEKSKVSEDQLMDLVLDHGAQEVNDDQDTWIIETENNDFLSLKNVIEQADIDIHYSDLEKVSDTRVDVSEDHVGLVQGLLDALDELEDVQNLYDNASLPQSE